MKMIMKSKNLPEEKDKQPVDGEEHHAIMPEIKAQSKFTWI